MMRQKLSNPLNPALYELLWELFDGNVLLSKRGRPFRYCLETRNGVARIRRMDGGEEYRVNCPLCRDGRNRCYINHRLGSEVAPGLTVNGLAHCFNEGCAGLPEWFAERMRPESINNVSLPAQELTGGWNHETIAAEAAANHEKLDGVRLLDQLPPEHPAIAYVRGRGFSPEYLAQSFHVGYYPGNGYGGRSKRVVAPVFYNGVEVGWNARAIPGHTRLSPGNPLNPWPYREGKYVNARDFPKSNFLYNLDQAREFDVIAVAEGITDVWRIGLWGVGLLGKIMSPMQRQLLCRTGEARKAWLLLFGDASTARDNAAKSWRKNRMDLLKAYRYPERVRLHLFTRGDPGERTSQELNELAARLMRESAR